MFLGPGSFIKKPHKLLQHPLSKGFSMLLKVPLRYSFVVSPFKTKNICKTNSKNTEIPKVELRAMKITR